MLRSLGYLSLVCWINLQNIRGRTTNDVAKLYHQLLVVMMKCWLTSNINCAQVLFSIPVEPTTNNLTHLQIYPYWYKRLSVFQ